MLYRVNKTDMEEIDLDIQDEAVQYEYEFKGAIQGGDRDVKESLSAGIAMFSYPRTIPRRQTNRFRVDRAISTGVRTGRPSSHSITKLESPTTLKVLGSAIDVYYAKFGGREERIEDDDNLTEERETSSAEWVS